METVIMLRATIQERLVELAPLVDEARVLEEKLEIIEAYEAKIAKLQEQIEKLKRPAGTKANVDAWARALAPDEHVKAAELAAYFDKKDLWARSQLKRLVEDGLMEKWGRGMWRQKPDRAGEATLRVVSR